MTPPQKLLRLADLAAILGTSEDAVSMRLSRDPTSLPPRWFPPGQAKAKRHTRMWHPDDVAAWLQAGRPNSPEPARQRSRRPGRAAA